MGHENTSCDPHLHQAVELPTLHYLTRSARRRAASFKSSSRKMTSIARWVASYTSLNRAANARRAFSETYGEGELNGSHIVQLRDGGILSTLCDV